MSQPIRDRLPTKADAPDMGGFREVLLHRNGRWFSTHPDNVKEGEWWRPIDQTPPPEPEKPKRREWWIETLRGTPQVLDIFHEEPTDKGGKVRAIEVLPGDPPDLDEFIGKAMDLAEAVSKPNHPLLPRAKDVIAARHGEGGDA